MSWLLRVGLMCGVFSLALLPGAAPAQTKDLPKEIAKAGEDRLTMESLKAILEGLAYEEVKELKDKDGKLESYQVKRVEGTWTYYGKFELSPDRTQLWISLTGPKVPDPSAVPSKVLLDMLAVNDDMWPSYFAYSNKTNRIYLYLPTPNTGLKAKDIRNKFDTLCAQYKTHEGLWNPKKWPTTTPAEKPPEKTVGN